MGLLSELDTVSVSKGKLEQVPYHDSKVKRSEKDRVAISP